MNIKSCADGYPSCRKAEAKGIWCKNKCEERSRLPDTRQLEDLAGIIMVFAVSSGGVCIPERQAKNLAYRILANHTLEQRG